VVEERTDGCNEILEAVGGPSAWLTPTQTSNSSSHFFSRLMKSSMSAGRSSWSKALPAGGTVGVDVAAFFPRGLAGALVFFEGVSSASSPLRFFPEAGVAGVAVAPGKDC
jgi:hypothetical protein